jgi:hypothetical protein
MVIRRHHQSRRCVRALGATVLALAMLVCAACGGAPRAATADLGAIRQPTPDPTLDAVVRDLPRVLAGVVVPSPSPTATPVPPTPVPTARTIAVPKPKPATPVPAAPTAKPTPRPIVVPSPTRPRP